MNSGTVTEFASGSDDAAASIETLLLSSVGAGLTEHAVTAVTAATSKMRRSRELLIGILDD